MWEQRTPSNAGVMSMWTSNVHGDNMSCNVSDAITRLTSLCWKWHCGREFTPDLHTARTSPTTAAQSIDYSTRHVTVMSTIPVTRLAAHVTTATFRSHQNNLYNFIVICSRTDWYGWSNPCFLIHDPNFNSQQRRLQLMFVSRCLQTSCKQATVDAAARPVFSSRRSEHITSGNLVREPASCSTALLVS